MRIKFKISKNRLKYMYYKKRLSTNKIAEIYKCSGTIILYKMKKFRLKIRNKNECHSGKFHHFYGKKMKKQHKENIRLSKIGSHYSLKTKKRMRKSHLGKKLSEKTKEKISKAHIGKFVSKNTKILMSNSQKLLWKDKKFAKKMFKQLNYRPTKPEYYIKCLLSKNFPHEWKYTGNGKFWINGKNPDFINCNGKKLVIEYNGFYTHTREEEIKRRRLFYRYGYRTLFLHQKDLKDKDKLYDKIDNFTK